MRAYTMRHYKCIFVFIINDKSQKIKCFCKKIKTETQNVSAKICFCEKSARSGVCPPLQAVGEIFT